MQTAQSGSRLIQLLRQHSAPGVSSSDKNVAEQLGQLVNLSDSITLADSLSQLPNTHFESTQPDTTAAKQAFLTARRAMVECIVKSFLSDHGHQPFQLPRNILDQATDASAAFEPYQKFYTLHQSEMDMRCHQLRRRTRQTLAGMSQPLAQLAALDKAMGDALAAQSRKLFSVIPKLLFQRFVHLHNERPTTNAEAQASSATDDNTATTAWLNQFHTEMQALLLAELEVRLQPALGLLEALDTNNETTV